MTPGRHGTVLVPSSSPLNPDPSVRSNTVYRPYSAYDVSAVPNGAAGTGWGGLSGGFGGDPLSAPSGFTSHSSIAHASAPRQRADLGRTVLAGEGRGGDGTSRKRLRGQSLEVSDIMHSPESPDIRPLGQRRNLVHTLPNDSEETLPDVHDLFDSPTTPQLARARATTQESPLPARSPTGEDVKFLRFSMTMPTHSKDIIRLAWQQSNEDARRASILLQDQAWLRNPRGVEQTPPEPIGRVKDIDDANKAERAAARERGKKSLIYANRLNLPVVPETSSTPSKKASPISFNSPLSPDVSRPRAKRAKKVVIDSDSEEVEDEDEEHLAKRQKVATEENRALEYFNTALAEGLQELTGSVYSHSYRSAI